MKSTALHEILAGLEQIEAEEHVKQKFKQLVCTIGLIHGARGMEHPERIDFAKHLLAAKTSRATIRDRLIARFGVSRSQAYTIISDALNCPVKAHLTGRMKSLIEV